MTLALTTDTHVLWWGTLGIGVVVAVVVVALLHRLLRGVGRIERNVTTLWNTATTVARNTATSWQLDTTARSLDELKAEAVRHDAVLSGNGHVTQPHERGAYERGTHQRGTHQRGTHQRGTEPSS